MCDFLLCYLIYTPRNLSFLPYYDERPGNEPPIRSSLD